MSASAGVVDRITSWEPGVGATGLRCVTDTESVFVTHFPQRPILPGVLLTASLTRLAGWAAAAGTGLDRGAELIGLRDAKFRRFVEPGDAVELTAVHLDTTADRSTWLVRARVDGKLVAAIGGLELVLRRRSAASTEADRRDFLTASRGRWLPCAIDGDDDDVRSEST